MAPDPLQEVMPLASTLGITTLRYQPAEVRARLEWAEGLCTSGELLHGGVIMALADTTGGACAFLNLREPGSGTSTIESKTNFLRPVSAGRIESSSRPLHTGRTVIVVETDVVDSEGRLVARTTQTQAVLPPRRSG
jgi:1,4-dihydroxy-2-naphthoyl-CoA hydrolase